MLKVDNGAANEYPIAQAKESRSNLGHAGYSLSMLFCTDDSTHKSGQPEDLCVVFNRLSAGISVALPEKVRAWRRMYFVLATPRSFLKARKNITLL